MTVQELEKIVMGQLGKLYRVAQRMAASESDAEDLVANTLLAAFKSCSQCDGRHPFAWLVRIMLNCKLHDARNQRSHTSEQVDDDSLIDAAAHHRLLDSVQHLDILAALDKLPEEYRVAVCLCDMEELDYAEAAIALNVPVGTIRSRLNRGRKLLQNYLSGWCSN